MNNIFKYSLRTSGIIICFILLGHLSPAQVTVSGTIKDGASKNPVEFATVALLSHGDSAVIKTDMTDRKGKFQFDSIQPGQYFLKTTFISYEQKFNPIVVANLSLNIGTINIFFTHGTLKDVTVISKSPLLNTSIDRKVYNVAQDIMANAGSASDILKNVPSVDVDIEGNVSLRGSGDVLILMNGRPSPLMGKSRAEVLQQLPANTIERIEVITNPSARYKPDGTAGIINIVLKKNIKNGFNGIVTVNAGTAGRYNGNANFNYKTEKLNLSGNYGIRKDYRLRTTIIDRSEKIPPKSSYHEDYSSYARPISHLGSLGIDYSFNQRNIFGITANFLTRKQVKEDITNRKYYDETMLLTALNDRLRYDPESEKEREAAIYWQHNFKKEDHELRLEFNSATDDEIEDNHYTDITYSPYRKTFDNTLIKQLDKQQNLTVDYTLPMGEDEQLEAGYEGNYSQADLDFYAEFYDAASSKFITDVSKSNHYLYRDQQHAAYATYLRSFDKWSYQAGIRLEQVFLKGNLVTLDSVFKNDYFKIYPTLHLSYKLKKGEIQLNYSRRVNRPDGDELNPFPEFRDPRNLSAGNPNLLPELIHSVELGYKIENNNFTFVPSLYYHYKKNGFTSVLYKIDDSTFITTRENLLNDRSAGLELILSLKDNKFFNLNLGSNLFYNSIDAAEPDVEKRSAISLSMNANATFAITKETMLQISSNIRSVRLTAQGKVSGSRVFNAGLRQDLFDKKMVVTFTISDIFKTQRQRTEINSGSLKQVAINRRDAQIMYLGISYRFGKTAKKIKDEKLQFDETL